MARTTRLLCLIVLIPAITHAYIYPYNGSCGSHLKRQGQASTCLPQSYSVCPASSSTCFAATCTNESCGDCPADWLTRCNTIEPTVAGQCRDPNNDDVTCGTACVNCQTTYPQGIVRGFPYCNAGTCAVECYPGLTWNGTVCLTPGTTSAVPPVITSDIAVSTLSQRSSVAPPAASSSPVPTLSISLAPPPSSSATSIVFSSFITPSPSSIAANGSASATPSLAAFTTIIASASPAFPSYIQSTQTQITTISPPFSPASTDSQGTNVGVIAGGTVGGVIGLASAGALFFFLTRRRRQRGNSSSSDPPKRTLPLPPPTSVSHEPQSSSSATFNPDTPPSLMSVNASTSRDPALFKDLNSPSASSYLIAPPDTPVIVAVAPTTQHPPPLPMLPAKHPSQFLSNIWSAPVPLPATPTFGAVNSTPVDSSAKQASLAGTLPAPISVATTPSTDSTANSAASAQPFVAAQTDSPHWAYVYLVGPVLAQSNSTNFPPDVPVLTVEHPFVPSRLDEIVLRSGDHFKLRTLFRDGWVWGTNVDTDQSGLIPLDCLRIAVNQPAFTGRSTRLESTYLAAVPSDQGGEGSGKQVGGGPPEGSLAGMHLGSGAVGSSSQFGDVKGPSQSEALD